jgi:hypothetical protein
MSGFLPRPDTGGITSKQTTTTSPLELGRGTYKTAMMANHASHDEEFSYEGLQSAGGPGNYANGYYAIVAVADFPADRLLSELQLQFDFSRITGPRSFALSPRIYALQIYIRTGPNTFAPTTYYGEKAITDALQGYRSEKLNFLIAMERVNYNTGNMTTVDPATVINQDPGKLLRLIDNVLDDGLILLLDIRLRNLFTKCSTTDLASCELGVIDLDTEFVTDVALSWFTSGIPRRLAKQYMVLMVCFVGLTNGLTAVTKTKLLKAVKLLDSKGNFNTVAIDKMLAYPLLEERIRHYLTSRHIDRAEMASEIEKDYVEGEVFSDAEILYGLFNRDKSDLAASSGGKSRRKHKKTRKRKPKSRKTRRKRSLLNRVKAWDR